MVKRPMRERIGPPDTAVHPENAVRLAAIAVARSPVVRQFVRGSLCCLDWTVKSMTVSLAGSDATCKRANVDEVGLQKGQARYLGWRVGLELSGNVRGAVAIGGDITRRGWGPAVRGQFHGSERPELWVGLRREF